MVSADAQCCSMLQSVGFQVTPGIPVFIVDTNGQAVGGSGVTQAGQVVTSNNNGQAAKFVNMQMCTCSAGVPDATFSGSARIRLRGGNNSGKKHAEPSGRLLHEVQYKPQNSIHTVADAVAAAAGLPFRDA